MQSNFNNYIAKFVSLQNCHSSKINWMNMQTIKNGK